MKKTLVLGALVLGTASMLCGFDSAETVESVTQKMQEASAAANSASMDMAMNVDIGVDIGDGQTTSTIAVGAKADFSVDAFMDPLAMKMAGSMTLSTFGQNQEINMEMYGVTNDNGEFETYTYQEDSVTGESGWMHQVSEGLNMTELMSASEAMDFAELAEWGMVFELAPEAADYNGTECYLLSATIDSDSFATMISKASELTGEALPDSEEIDIVLSLLDGIQMNLEYYVDTQTFLPVFAHFDMDGSDFSVISQLIQAQIAASGAESNTTVALNINDLSIDMPMTYGEAEEVVVPEEAIASATEISDITDSLESSLESELDAFDTAE